MGWMQQVGVGATKYAVGELGYGVDEGVWEWWSERETVGRCEHFRVGQNY